MPLAVPKLIWALIQYKFKLDYSNNTILIGPYYISSYTLRRIRCTWLNSSTIFIIKENTGGKPQLINDFYK